MSVCAAHRSSEQQGMSLVEVVVAILLLAIIAVGLLPALWQGIIVSSQQSSIASATRLLNARIEEARTGKSCAAVLAADDARIPAPTDGRGNELTVSFVGGPPACTPSTTVSFTIQVGDQLGVVLASAPAIVFVP